MNRIFANNATETIIFLVLALVWVVVQLLNRAGKKPEKPRAPGESATPPPPPPQRPHPPALSPEEELRRFLRDLSGAPPEPVEEDREPAPATATARELAPRVYAEPPPPPPRPQPAATMRAAASGPARPPRGASPRPSVSPAPSSWPASDSARQGADRMARAAAQGISESMRQLAPRRGGEHAALGAASLKLGMPAVPMMPSGTGAAFRSGSGATGRNRVPRGDRKRLREAVLFNTLLAPPRALAPPGSDLPYAS